MYLYHYEQWYFLVAGLPAQWFQCVPVVLTMCTSGLWEPKISLAQRSSKEKCCDQNMKVLPLEAVAVTRSPAYHHTASPVHAYLSVTWSHSLAMYCLLTGAPIILDGFSSSKQVHMFDVNNVVSFLHQFIDLDLCNSSWCLRGWLSDVIILIKNVYQPVINILSYVHIMCCQIIFHLSISFMFKTNILFTIYYFSYMQKCGPKQCFWNTFSNKIKNAKDSWK